MSDIDNWAKQVDTENMPLNKNNENDKESTFQETTTNKDIACAFKVPCWSCNIPLYIHYTLPVYWIVASLFGLSSISKFIFFLVVNGPVLFGTVFVHELGTKRVVSSLLPKIHTHSSRKTGHAAAAYMSKGQVSHILLWPLGGLVYIAHQAGHCADIFISLAGPLTHIPMFLIWMLLNRSAEPMSGTIKWYYYGHDNDYFEYFWGNLCVYAMSINIGLFVFNLFVPAYPLDGGRILANLVRSHLL